MQRVLPNVNDLLGMMTSPRSLTLEAMKRFAVLALALVLALARSPGIALADDTLHQQEAQIGVQEEQELAKKGEIIPRPNPMYDVLDPIAARIGAIANPQYDFPFTFILVHEAQPNAFAVPGGHVYVTDSLMKFVQNKEELAGVLCHETSHDIHHDVVNNNSKDQTVAGIIGILGAITGVQNTAIGRIGESAAYTLQSDHFSRTVEHNADHKGAITCAQAGFNPWGMIWLFENFEKADTGGSMEALSDHPTDKHRITDLKAEFAADPSTFGKYTSNIASATPLSTSTAPMAAHLKPANAASPSGRFCCSPKS